MPTTNKPTRKPTRGDDLYIVTVTGLDDSNPGTSDISDVIQCSGYQEAIIRITAGSISAGTEYVALIASNSDGSAANVIPEDAGFHKRADISSNITNAGYLKMLPQFLRVSISGGATIASAISVEIILKRTNVRE